MRSMLVAVVSSLLLLSGAHAAEPGAKTEALQELGDWKVCGPASGLALYGESGPSGGLWDLEESLGQEVGGAPSRGVIVSFAATWCPNCVKGLQALERLAPEAKKAHVEIVVVMIPQFTTSIAAFMKGIGVTLPALKDKFGTFYKRWTGGSLNPARLPYTFVINSAQQLVGIYGSEGADFEAVMRQALEDGEQRCRRK